MSSVLKAIAGLALMFAVARGVMVGSGPLLDDGAGGIIVATDSPSPPMVGASAQHLLHAMNPLALP